MNIKKLKFVVPSILFFVLVSASEYGTIKGFVTDASNGEKLSYVDVIIENTGQGASTDEKGYYYIPRIPAGSQQVIFSYIGYETVKKDILLTADKTVSLNIELKTAAIEVSGVIVTAERERFEKSVEVSHVTFSPKEIKSIPTLFEADLIKSLQLMPGVVSMHDLSNKLYVRGGSPDENLVLLDGIIVYNPSTHLGGLFSTFNPDAVSEAEMYAGGFPAKYGDRLSAVLDITTKEGNSKKYTGQASVGLVTSKFLIEGPIPKGSLLFSGRRTYFDALIWAYANLFSKDVELPYYFYDGVAKVNYNPSSDNRFTLTGFGGSDVIIFEEEGSDAKVDLTWGNRGASLRWRRVFTPRLYGTLLGVWSNFFTHLRYEDLDDSTNNLHLIEEIKSVTGKCDLTYLLNERHTLEFGVHEENLRVDQQWELEEGAFGPPIQKSNSFAFYVQDKWALKSPVLFIQPGIRMIHYDQGNRFAFNPRLGLKYNIGVNSALNLAVGKYNQFLVTINSQESYFSIFDFWRPVDESHIPPVSYQAIAGIEQWLGEGTVFTLETYYKKYYGLLIPDEDDMFFSTPTESLGVGNGYATGFDVFLKKTTADYFGWISYSFCWTRRQVGAESYFPRYDRRNNLNIVLGFTVPNNIPLFKRGSLDLRWYLGSGLPYAGAIGKYWYVSDYDGGFGVGYEWRVIKGPKDAFRLPLSHRLDLHYERQMRFFGLKGSWYFDIINLYARRNILFYEWELYEIPPKKTGYSILPIPVPSFGFSFEF